jgi:hypothetical protein
MTDIKIALCRAENSLRRAGEVFNSVKRAYGPVVRQEQQARRELPQTDDHADVTSHRTGWTHEQLLQRKAAGLGKDAPPVVGALDNQQIHERCLAGLPVKPAASITVRSCAFLPALAQQVHHRIDVLDRALVTANAAVDGKAALDLEGFPKLMTAAELWRAIEEETSALRHAARP